LQLSHFGFSWVSLGLNSSLTLGSLVSEVGIKSKGFHKQHKKIHNCILKIVLQNNQYNSNPNTFNMTKISAVAFSLAVVFQQAEAFAFIATRSLASPATVTFAQKPHRESAFGRDIDLAKANDMADHFGKYSLEEVEQMRRGMCLGRALSSQSSIALTTIVQYSWSCPS